MCKIPCTRLINYFHTRRSMISLYGCVQVSRLLSILDATLLCILQRIKIALKKPSKKEKMFLKDKCLKAHRALKSHREQTGWIFLERTFHRTPRSFHISWPIHFSFRNQSWGDNLTKALYTTMFTIVLFTIAKLWDPTITTGD